MGKRTLSIASCVLHRRLCVFFTHSQRCYLGFWRRFNVVYVFYCHGVEKGSLMRAVVCSDWGTCAAAQLGGQQGWTSKSLFQNLEISPVASCLRNLEDSQEGRAWARKRNRRVGQTPVVRPLAISIAVLEESRQPMTGILQFPIGSEDCFRG